MTTLRRSPSCNVGGTLLGALRLLGFGAVLAGCSTHHWAQVEESHLAAPPGERVLHTSRVIVSVSKESHETQCVVYEKHHPVCFFNIRTALENGLSHSLWPTFPEVVIGEPKDAGPGDYLLQVEVTLDALPPDDAGPGWSAGARSRFRLLREGKVVAEETLASRSRAQFPYGSSLGAGATEVIDATVLHMATALYQVPETRPDRAEPLPVVAARKIEPSKSKLNQAKPGASTESQLATKPSEKTSASDKSAKTSP